MTTNANPISNQDIVTGAAAEGHGALIGWSGLGSLSRAELLQALSDAGLPESWAPSAKTTVAHAGRAVQSLNGRGYVTRRARVERSRFESSRQWVARWIVFRAEAGQAELGDKAGEVILTVELLKGSDELQAAGLPSLVHEVEADYRALRDAELYSAADVTAWIRSLLYVRCGATAFGVGYYVPAAGRAVAAAIANAMARRWGAGWIAPPLPVATGDELRVGVARGLLDDVRSIARSFEAVRARAVGENRNVRPGEAARFLSDLSDVNDRTGAYRLLCGDAVIAPIVAEMSTLRATLAPLTDDASVRFSLLDLDTPIETAPEPARLSIAERAADQALARRQQAAAEVPSVAAIEAINADIVRQVQADDVARGATPAKVTVVEPLPEPDDSDASIRFGLLELD